MEIADKIIKIIAERLQLKNAQIAKVLDLMEAGATIPFLARYRKEQTGQLDEVQLAAIRDLHKELSELEKRRTFILEAIDKQGKLDDSLKQQILSAPDLPSLEDLYLPFKQKKKTRASIAREKGLQALADAIWEQRPINIDQLAQHFVDPQKGVHNVNEALEGARDIVAEQASEHNLLRAELRRLFARSAILSSKAARGKKEEDSKYKDYVDWAELAHKAPSHRILALFRGENEGLLKLHIAPDSDEAFELVMRRMIKNRNGLSRHFEEAMADAYKRLIQPSLENEFRQILKEKADKEAVRIFADNVRQLLLESPLGQKNVLAIDPGFRTGCKVVCLNAQGDLLHNETLYFHSGLAACREAESKLEHKIQAYKIEAIALGNGTAGRETEAILRKNRFISSIPIIMVNESGASIYSASAIAREEFPDYDVTVRGAVSIGRRLMDPLAELVKIEPKSIGVGQYQHDVDQSLLNQSLSDVVSAAVNSVGVELNTASKSLLTYVSGLGPALAENIIQFRKENGAFKSRRDLLKVSRMGQKAFEQAAGFLRIKNTNHPLDASGVHPESYHIVEKMAQDLKCTVNDLITNKDLRQQIDLKQYCSDNIGLPTLSDIMKELEKPGRDPREAFKMVQFDQNIHDISQLQTGMILTGVVSNITAFGCFVDIGVHQDGLVHISELANRFVKDPNEIVTLRQSVQVKVLEIDVQRKRIQLSMKQV